jgi:hypothetical protein
MIGVVAIPLRVRLSGSQNLLLIFETQMNIHLHPRRTADVFEAAAANIVKVSRYS